MMTVLNCLQVSNNYEQRFTGKQEYFLSSLIQHRCSFTSENDLNKHLKSTHHWCCNRQQYDTVFNIFLSVIYIYQFSQSQRTAEFEQDLWRSSSLQCSEQGHWSRFLQDHVQFGFEYLQGQRFHNLPRQPVPMFYHPQSKKMFLVFK